MIEKIIAGCADLSVLAPVILLVMNGIQNRSATNTLMTSYVLLMFVRNAVTLYMVQMGIYNIYLYNWHNFFSFILMAILYYFVLQNRYFKLYILIAILLSIFVTFLDYQSLFNVKTVDFNRFSYNTSGCLAIIMILMYFYELIQNLQVPELKTSSLFWFSSGSLFYYSGTIFSYIFIENTFNDLTIRDQYWTIDSLFSIIFNIFLAIAIWYMKPTSVRK